MAATKLAEEVTARRTELGMQPATLAKRAGMSRKTLREIEEANPTRRYGSGTLGKLDSPLGWEPGKTWRIWREQPGPNVAELVADVHSLVDERTATITRLVAQLLELPVWAPEIIDALRLLSPEDRARVLDFARRLGR